MSTLENIPTWGGARLPHKWCVERTGCSVEHDESPVRFCPRPILSCSATSIKCNTLDPSEGSTHMKNAFPECTLGRRAAAELIPWINTPGYTLNNLWSREGLGKIWQGVFYIFFLCARVDSGMPGVILGYARAGPGQSLVLHIRRLCPGLVQGCQGWSRKAIPMVSPGVSG